MLNDRLPGADGDAGLSRAERRMGGPSPWLGSATALALGLLVVAGMVQPAVAQRNEAARIVVAPAIVAEPASQTAFAIQVGPANALPGNSFVRLRGLPTSVSLTEGHAIAPGSWAIPLFALSSLKAIVPAGVSGRSEIIVQLVSMDGTTLAESRTALVVGPATLVAPAARLPAEPPPKRASPVVPTPPPAVRVGPPPRASDLAGEERSRAERMVAEGERRFEQGNIGAARMFFQRAADAGLAAAAIKMATTYDPAELARLEVMGVTPDRAEARKWYERARELGAPEAEDRLARIGAR
jgi:hypothetical protein